MTIVTPFKAQLSERCKKDPLVLADSFPFFPALGVLKNGLAKLLEEAWKKIGQPGIAGCEDLFSLSPKVHIRTGDQDCTKGTQERFEGLCYHVHGEYFLSLLFRHYNVPGIHSLSPTFSPTPAGVGEPAGFRTGSPLSADSFLQQLYTNMGIFKYVDESLPSMRCMGSPGRMRP